MSLGMQQENKIFCPTTPDRVRTSDCALELFREGGELAAAPRGSPVCARSCYTPIRQLPLHTPASCKAPMTGCSGASLATPLRGVATPMRASRRCSVTARAEEEEEPNAPLPRTLNLCGCGHCAECATHASAQSSLARVKPLRLSELADPSPASPGQSPSEGDIPDALTLGASSLRSRAGVTQELLLCGSSSSVRDPRKRQRYASSRVVVIPTGFACVAEHSGVPSQKVGDPRLLQKPVLAAPDAPVGVMLVPNTTMLRHDDTSRGNCEPHGRRKGVANDLGQDAEPLQTAASRKRCRSPALMLAPAHLPRSATLRTRRYRSPTPGPEHSQACSRGSQHAASCRTRRYRSPTPVPSCGKFSDPDGEQHSLIVDISL